MAQIDIETIKYINKERYMLHAKVFTTYSSFEHEGRKYFQIDTYGRADREMPEKISQSIQLDKDSAQLLVDLLKKEFDL